MKAKFLWLISSGALIGGALATWLGPKSIVYYFKPPVEYGVSCTAPIEWALHKIVVVQGMGMIVGGLIGLAGFVMLWRKAVHRGVDSSIRDPRAF